MSYLQITVIEKINTSTDDLFTNSDANGILIVIKQVSLFGNDGIKQRDVKLNQQLIDVIKKCKIKL